MQTGCISALLLLLALSASTGPSTASTNTANAVESENKLESLQQEVRRLRKDRPESIALASALARLGLAAESFDQWQLAGQALQECLTISRRHPGKDNGNLIVALIYLADHVRHQGRYSQARRLAQEAARLGESGKQEDLAVCLSKLALIEDGAGCYAAGEAYARRALEIFKRISLTAPSTAVASLALADNLRQQGKYREALPILKEATAILKESGAGSPYAREAATARNNLGALYFWLGDYTNAEIDLNEALKMRLAVLPPESEEIANSLGDLAAVYHKTGRYQLCEEKLRQALKIRLSTLGRNHRETAILLGNLGNLYSQQAKYEEARDYYQQALQTLRAAGLQDHPEAGEYLEGLGLLETKQGNLPLAEKYLERSLKLRERTFGEQNPDTAKSKLALGRLLLARADKASDPKLRSRYLDSALAKISSAKETLERTLGPEHNDLKAAGESLAECLKARSLHQTAK
ncbi:MAG: tetratricopeptide repeat protein [Candidatus Melainabacteria bacterium]|nr:tetratricopeptide repeat protein [Candidatus Melainabacteria bacterium]